MTACILCSKIVRIRVAQLGAIQCKNLRAFAELHQQSKSRLTQAHRYVLHTLGLARNIYIYIYIQCAYIYIYSVYIYTYIYIYSVYTVSLAGESPIYGHIWCI
jgi:hypothetical protein